MNDGHREDWKDYCGRCKDATHSVAQHFPGVIKFVCIACGAVKDWLFDDSDSEETEKCTKPPSPV